VDFWRSFRPGQWMHEIDVRDFIQKNYHPYEGDASFLSPPTERTSRLWKKCSSLLAEERKRQGVYEVDPDIPLNITSHPPGYIDRDLEVIVGLQTDQPLKRAIQVYGGLRHAANACKAYGYQINPQVEEFFAKHRRTHNEGVFTVYTPEMRLARSSGIITGLPDSYGRGRIIGDYRRIALYGVDRLIEAKELDRRLTSPQMTDSVIRLREELYDQIQALKELREMALSYGFDISQPASDATQAVQWLYFGFLAAIKEQNGAAMSLGRVSTFLDIYIQREDVKRQVFPVGWEANLSRGVFENWKKELEKTAEQLRQARLQRETELQDLQAYWRQVQNFWHHHPYEQYNQLREELRSTHASVVQLDQSIRAQENREQEISRLISQLRKRLQDTQDEISFLSQRLLEAQRYLRKAAERERLRTDIEQNDQLIKERGRELTRWERELHQWRDQLNECQQDLNRVHLQISHLQNEDLFKQVQDCQPQPTDLSRLVLTRQRQDLLDNLQQKQQGRQLIEERLQVARQTKEQLEMDLKRSSLVCEYEIDTQLAFPPGGDQEIDLLLPRVQAGKAKLDQLNFRLEQADKDYRVKEDRYKRQEEEFFRNYSERRFHSDDKIVGPVISAETEVSATGMGFPYPVVLFIAFTCSYSHRLIKIGNKTQLCWLDFL
jgi:hypothetical protein